MGNSTFSHLREVLIGGFSRSAKDIRRHGQHGRTHGDERGGWSRATLAIVGGASAGLPSPRYRPRSARGNRCEGEGALQKGDLSGLSLAFLAHLQGPPSPFSKWLACPLGSLGRMTTHILE